MNFRYSIEHSDFTEGLCLRKYTFGDSLVCALFLSSCGKSTDSSSTDYDTTAPTVSSTNPASDVTGVAVDSKIFVTFSEAMDVSTINTTNFTLSGSSGAVSGTVTYSGTVATFIPSTSLSPFSTYTAKITHVRKGSGRE
ncbi:MAG TPA: hypothetical protein DDX84_02785 [Nitrospiraceae bacterium]|nr:hypothetical protein [Nitrospiraceae bacterium]